MGLIVNPVASYVFLFFGYLRFMSALKASIFLTEQLKVQQQLNIQ